MNRIEKKLQTLQEKNEKAFITYITAGLPDMEHCAKLIRAHIPVHTASQGKHQPAQVF